MLLIAGLALLLFCGDLLVRGAVALAVKLDIPSLVIGLTIVAFGTSAPELVVSLRAALAGSPGIAVGNVVGSNIANVFLVLGIPALISSIDCEQPFIKRNTAYVLVASVIFAALCFNDPLATWHGAVLFGLMIAFLVESGRRAAQRSDPGDVLGEETIELIDGVSGLPVQGFGILGCLTAGLIGLPLGAQLTVDSAVKIAMNFGIAEAAIGLTVIAIGTSLPELATTVAAAMRGHAGVALGNVLGSNLFNILAIMGLTALVTPVPVPEVIKQMDIWVMLGASGAAAIFILGRRPITRIPGLAFVTFYLAYIIYVFLPRMNGIALTQLQ
ncbi:MAG: calcium/sodium antiporter [Methyloligellaceae bacterium]